MTRKRKLKSRRHIERQRVRPLKRDVIRRSKNAWLLTLDEVVEEGRDRPFHRIQRWRPAFEGTEPVYRPKGGFNVRSSDEWRLIRDALDKAHPPDLLPGPQVGEADDEVSVDIDVEPAEAQDATESLPVTPIPVSQSTVRVQHRQEARMSTVRYERFRARRRTYQLQLQSLKEIVFRKRSTETEVQKFFKGQDAFWLFGLQYIEIKEKVSFPPESPIFEFDLMLKRTDGYLDLVELKGPHTRAFIPVGRRKRRFRFNHTLGTALGQVFAYQEACAQQADAMIRHPRAIVVAGQDASDNPGQRRLLAAHITQLEVVTYSDIIRNGEALLRQMETRGRSPKLG